MGTIKAETVRGLMRTALGRQHKLLINDHEECECLLCCLFGSEHQMGKIRFEDLTLKGFKDAANEQSGGAEPRRMDHVAIDRFTAGAVKKLKFDDNPLVPKAKAPLIFEGHFWIPRDLEDNNQGQALIDALIDLHDGLLPIGAKGSIGYGWVHDLAIEKGPDWLKKGLLEKIGILHMNTKVVYTFRVFVKSLIFLMMCKLPKNMVLQTFQNL